MKIFIVLLLGLTSISCAGKAVFRNYEVIDGEKVLTSITEISAKNIKVTIKDASAESKPLTFPTLPAMPILR